MNSGIYFNTLCFDVSDTESYENMNTSDNEKPPISWRELPSIAIEKIYSYLSREDQFAMSMVCRNWNKEYKSSSLWREMKFIIPVYNLYSDVCPEIYFARKYGYMFHHIEVICNYVPYNHMELITEQLKLFLQALSFHSKLETVSFKDMQKYFRCLHDTTFNDVYQCIKDFFLSQNKLKTAEFQNAHFKNSEAVEILKIIFRNNSQSLQIIRLKGFVDKTTDSNEVTENVLDEAIVFESFLNIKSLETDYTQFFENIATNFYEYAQNLDTRRIKGNLELIKLFCGGCERKIFQGIPPKVWKFFVKLCPSLRISLNYFISSHINNTIYLFIVRNMPLKKLKFRWHMYQTGSETEICVLLRHLQSSGTHEYLEELTIMWLKNMNNLAPDLINFVQTCEKLRVLQLYTEDPIESLDVVFISCLKTGVHISSALFRFGKFDYCPLLQIHGFNLLLIGDSKFGSRH